MQTRNKPGDASMSWQKALPRHLVKDSASLELSPRASTSGNALIACAARPDSLPVTQISSFRPPLGRYSPRGRQSPRKKASNCHHKPGWTRNVAAAGEPHPRQSQLPPCPHTSCSQAPPKSPARVHSRKMSLQRGHSEDSCSIDYSSGDEGSAFHSAASDLGFDLHSASEMWPSGAQSEPAYF